MRRVSPSVSALALSLALPWCAAIVATSRSAPAHHPAQKSVAVYRDAGVWAAEGSRGVPALLEWLGHDFTWVDARQIEGGVLHKNGKRAFDLLVVPGGWAGDYIARVGGWRGEKRGDDEIRKFVAGGGGYLGFCAGAFAACSTTRWLGRDIAYSWKLFDGVGEGPLAWNRLRRGGYLRAGHGTAELDLNCVELKGRGLPATVRPMLYGGPRFLPRNAKSLLDWRVLAKHGEDKSAAIVAFRYGGKTGGRVVLCSFHPSVLTHDGARFDREPDDFAWALAGVDPDGEAPDWKLAAALVDVALDTPARHAPPMPRVAGSIQIPKYGFLGRTTPVGFTNAGASTNAVYLAAASFDVTPGIRFQDGVIVPLRFDPLFVASLELPSVFRSFVGTFDSTGRAAASLVLPAVLALKNRSIKLAFLTLDRGRLSVSAPATTTLL